MKQLVLECLKEYKEDLKHLRKNFVKSPYYKMKLQTDEIEKKTLQIELLERLIELEEAKNNGIN